MSITSQSLPYPTREISDNLPLFLSDIGAVAVPVRVTGTQTIVALKGSTYITHGSGTITFTDPAILDAVSGDHYKVIVGGTSAAVIGGVTYNVASPIEILRLVSNGAWITYGGINASQVSGTFTGNVIGNVTGNATTATTATNFSGALTGDVTGTQGATAISAATVTGKALAGYVSTTGAINTNDSILSAIAKLNGNVGLKADSILTGYVSTTGTISITDSILSAIGKLNGNIGLKANSILTGYASTTGTISATDTILSAIGKLNGNVGLKADAVVPIVPISNGTTFTQTDNAKIFHASGTTTFALPVASNVSDGWSIGIVNVGGAPITINRNGTNTINGTLTTFSNTVPYSAFYIYKSSSSTFIAIGVLY